ncbi:MAG: hypothetical protein AB7I30_01945 [Isosphaeraceae bacterium]
MDHAANAPTDALEALRAALDARAAGWWRPVGDRLVQIAFAAAPDLPNEVAAGFTEATLSVPLGRTDLGIVRAQTTGNVAVSRVEECAEDHGSGLWLRRFGASRSVAVPLPGKVVSVATSDPQLSDEELADRVREAARTWGDPDGMDRNGGRRPGT